MLNPLKVLVADDDERIRYAFRKTLERDGFDYVEAKDGLEALQKIQDEQPSVVFMDMKMPKISGMEVLKRTIEKNRFARIIFITGHGSVETAFRAMQYGAIEYIMKPLSVDKIRRAIRRAILYQGSITEIDAQKFTAGMKA
jgi:DNA-binding NtrC family response regulator